MVIGFWNINNNADLGDLLIDFVKEYSIDILLLAESEIDLGGKRTCLVDDVILDFLKKSKMQFTRTYRVIPNQDFRVKVISSFPSTVFEQQSSCINSSRWSAFFVNIPGIIKFNLFPVHFQSKVNWSESSLALECVNFARDIKLVESKTFCANSILIGDFNMNPFEDGIVASNGLNSHQDLNYLSNNLKGRDIDGTLYKFFNNPMWNFLGDNEIPYGTLYHRTSGHISHEWHIFDQIMIRPEMKAHISKKSFKIVSNICGQTLLKKYNRPNDKYSDHLPIILELFT